MPDNIATILLYNAEIPTPVGPINNATILDLTSPEITIMIWAPPNIVVVFKICPVSLLSIDLY